MLQVCHPCRNKAIRSVKFLQMQISCGEIDIVLVENDSEVKDEVSQMPLIGVSLREIDVGVTLFAKQSTTNLSVGNLRVTDLADTSSLYKDILTVTDKQGVTGTTSKKQNSLVELLLHTYDPFFPKVEQEDLDTSVMLRTESIQVVYLPAVAVDWTRYVIYCLVFALSLVGNS